MKAVRLRTEYLSEPLGIDITRPRLYWNCDEGERQTAYRIVAVRDGDTVWDTGKVPSSRMSHIAYDGAPLGSRDCVAWSVTLWDEDDRAGEPAHSRFELGLLAPDDWSARWITGDYTPVRDVRYPVDCFRRTFRTRGPARRARLYITACGIYEARIDGRRVGEFQLAPGATDYRHRLQYQTYDVTDLVTGRGAGPMAGGGAGDHVLEVDLADGWYRGSVGCFGVTHVFGRETKLLCQLEVTYDDGSRDTIVSDDAFAWSNDGPVRFADLKDGEVYDAAMSPTYTRQARLTREHLTPTASNNVEPRTHEVFPARLLTTPGGARVLDFGQNIAGFVGFTAAGRKGQQITLRLGEVLDEDGEFTQANMQVHKPVKEFGPETEMLLITGQTALITEELQPTPRQEVTFRCSGTGRDHYRTAFAVFGFRYALVETDVDIDPADFHAVAVYSAMPQAGTFACSNPDVNRFLENTRWSMKGNFLDVPTDCPTRERLGWTGDAQIFVDTAAYLMDVAPFFRKWLLDVRDGQFADGTSSAVVPYNGASVLYDNSGVSVGWADAVVLIPYRLWKRYGDEEVIRDCYDTMRRYAQFMIDNTGHQDPEAAKANPYDAYVYEKGLHLGEWLEPTEFRDPMPSRAQPPRTEECTAYLYYTMRHMAEIAQALGHVDDAALFARYADGAKTAYQHLFLTQGGIDTDRQAKLVRPLALGLLDGEPRRKVQERLVTAVEQRGYRVGTGFLSTPFILPALTDAGRADVAYRMLENDQAPSWLAQVHAGATTVWEDWEGTASHNHYSPGAVCQWLFDTAAGIRVDGENHFVVAPVPGGTLTHVRAAYTSLYGTVHSHWEKTPAGLTVTVTVPSNTRADVRLPNGEKRTVPAGTHAFTITD
ncbi:glycoside hydrolase family 78 protein [Yinghuangia aomiensis]|uniref:alpha-L-rhamnosidase n=1 Tax=Yinghuangia aomiensis TaxID=676205 RepID=A0ABP9HXR6_9ACTN